MIRVLEDTCYYIAEQIRTKEISLKKAIMAVTAESIRYDIARAKAKLKHYEQMYKELKKYGYVEDKETMEIELDEKLEEIEKQFRAEPEERYKSIFDDEE